MQKMTIIAVDVDCGVYVGVGDSQCARVGWFMDSYRPTG